MKTPKMKAPLLLAVAVFSATFTAILSNPLPDSSSEDEYYYYDEEPAEKAPAEVLEVPAEVPEVVPEVLPAAIGGEEDEHAHHEMAVPIKAEISPPEEKQQDSGSSEESMEEPKETEINIIPEQQPEVKNPEIPAEVQPDADVELSDIVASEEEGAPEAQAGPDMETAPETEVVVPVVIKAILPNVTDNGNGSEANATNVIPPVLQEETDNSSLVIIPTLAPTHSPSPPTQPSVRLQHVKIPKSCKQPPVTGMCRGAFPMFYFDEKTLTCKQFVYGGCRGNINIHKSAQECYMKCYPQGLKRIHTEESSRTSKNSYLTVRGGTGASSLTFMGKNAAAKIDPAVLSDFTIEDVYAFEFDFRTDSPHGLIAFLRQVSVPDEMKGTRIQLYIYLKKGHLAVTHVFGNHTETFVMRRGGFQALTWHSGTVQIDSQTGELALDVDDVQEYFTIGSLGLNPHYGRRASLEGFRSVLWVGGVSEEDLKSEKMLLGFVPFHGCIQQMRLSSGPTSEDMVGVQPLVATRHSGVKEHCVNNCNDNHKNLCSQKSHCVEHFDHSTCNCFNSGQDGPRCTNPALPVLSLNGDGYVVHRLYEWMDRVHSYNNLISVAFKTRFTDSILLYASAEHPERQYIAASITKRGTIYVEVNFGGGADGAEIGENLDSEVWRTLTIIHRNNAIMLYIGGRLEKTLQVYGKVHYLHLDPEFYLGNAPDLSRACGLALDTGSSVSEDKSCSSSSTSSYQYYYDKYMGSCQPFNYTGCGGNANRFPDEESCMDTCYVPGLRSLNTYMGCLRNAYFNDVSILQSLRENNKNTKYLGSTKEAPLGTTCNYTKFLPLTFSTERAAMELINPEPNDFHLILSFRPTQPKGVLASGEVEITEYEATSQWELRHDAKHVYFYVHDELLNIKSDAKISIGNWHYVEVHYKAGRLNMMINNKKQGKAGPGKLIFSSKVTIGKNILDAYPGFVGCIRKLTIGQTKLDLRTVVGTPMANKDVTYDNGQVMGPCEGPLACEHGGKCSIDEDGEVHCDCSGTGYSGKKCHFSLYKRSCEQYRQLGFSSTGIYHIDIDGNGPLPPAYVKCDFKPLVAETHTTIEHNIEEQYEVRRLGMQDFQLNVKYRDFCPTMLTAIMDQSLSCSQKIEYECRRAPLHLSTETWFASPAKNYFSNFAAKLPGICNCKEHRSCEKVDVPCNCDINDGTLRKDKGIITEPDQLPITSMVFVQSRDQREDSEAHVTLKPLVCVTKASKEQSVSFTASSSYLEVPAWREGSLSLLFRTTKEKAIVAYQPAYHPRHATFMISLISASELDFMYRYQGQVHQQVLRSTKPLNDGQWQQVLVDVYNHQLRFVINSEEKIIDVDPNAYLGVLDGSMFLGGIPEQFQEIEAEEIENLKLGGLIGCIQGLTLNEEMVDMEGILGTSSSGVVLGCTQSCDPNPCQNGAKCNEMWGSYTCECANPLAHSGRNCEENLNVDAITFKTDDSKYKYFDNDTSHSGEKLFNETFFINFRTHSRSGGILFAYNHLHNFVQLYLASENEVVFMFNYGSEVTKMAVVASDGVVFNDGQSVQVKVDRSNVSTTLNVFTKGSLFQETLDKGYLLLQEEDYEQFPFGESQPLPEMVYYPHSMTKPRPFFLAYLGSANDKQHDISSDIPGITGCLRGLMIAGRILPLDKLLEKSPFSNDGVVTGCKMVCDETPCRNGGKCTEDFQSYNNFRCDCKETSYTGSTCNTELGYTFSGRQWISQDATASPLDQDLKLEIAFSTSSRYTEKQVVALLRSTHPSTLHDYLLVWINRDGSIVVEAELHGFDEDQVHGAQVTPSIDNINAFDGMRHYVIVEKKDGAWTVKIDGTEREVEPLRNVFISETHVQVSSKVLYIGGLVKGLDDRLADYHNYHGCVSNMRLSTPLGVSYPLREYSESDLHFNNHGIPGQGKCAGFAHFGYSASVMMNMMQAKTNNLNVSAVMGNEWVYRRPEKMSFETAYLVNERPERDTVFDNVVPTVCGIVFAVTLLLLIVLLLKSYFKKKKKLRDAVMKKDDKKPLFNGRTANSQYKPRSNTMIIKSDNQETVPLKSAPDGIIQSSPAVTQEVYHPEKPSDIPLEEIKLVIQSPAKEEEASDVPEVPSPVEEKQFLEAVVDVTEEVQVHSDAAAAEEEAGDSDEAQVRRGSNSEEGEITGRPLSWDKSTDNLPLIIVQEGLVAGQTSGGDTSSESSIDVTLDINPSPPSSPVPEPVPDDSDDPKTKEPSPVPPPMSGIIPSSPDQNEDTGVETDEDSDPEVVLVSHVLLPEANREGLATSNSELETGAPAEEPASGEAKGDIKPEAESESDGSANEGTKAEDKTKTKIDFSNVPVIKIVRSESEDAEVVVDNDSDSSESSQDSKKEKDTAGPEGEEKTPDTDDEFVEYRDENVKVGDAERMSKPI